MALQNLLAIQRLPTFEPTAEGVHQRNHRGHITASTGFTREGMVLIDCTLAVFRTLKSKRLIAARNGQPYSINRSGLCAVRPQLDNQ
jgi:uncharacterized protein